MGDTELRDDVQISIVFVYMMRSMMPTGTAERVEHSGYAVVEDSRVPFLSMLLLSFVWVLTPFRHRESNMAPRKRRFQEPR